MNLEDSDRFLEEQAQAEKKKKIVLVLIGFCSILIVLLFILIVYIKYLDSLELKLFVNGEKKDISDNFLITQNNTEYVNIKEISSILDYNYTKGEYGVYNEDENSCYVNNDLEVAAMTADSEKFTKYIDVKDETALLTEEGPFGSELQVKSENGKFNTFTIENPVISIKGELYMSLDMVRDVYNVSLDISEENRIKLTTLPELFKSAKEIATQLGYTGISGCYENIRSLPYNLIVVSKDDNFGVIDISQKGKEVLSIKYEDLEFIQNSKEFFMTAENTVGLLDCEGKTIIKPMEYDEISVLDEVTQLYLVKKSGKYGVLNRKGDIIVHVDYDRIGLKEKELEAFKTNIEGIRNTDLLFEECIVVESDSKYGMFDITGKELLKTTYDTLGYTKTSDDSSNEDSVLIIPEESGIKGIVVCYEGVYGIYDVNVKKLIIPCACSKIYSITAAGKTTYYMEFNGEQLDLNNYLVSYGLKSTGKSKTKETTTDSSDNTETNTTTNTSTNTTTDVQADTTDSTDDNVISDAELEN